MSIIPMFDVIPCGFNFLGCIIISQKIYYTQFISVLFIFTDISSTLKLLIFETTRNNKIMSFVNDCIFVNFPLSSLIKRPSIETVYFIVVCLMLEVLFIKEIQRSQVLISNFKAVLNIERNILAFIIHYQTFTFKNLWHYLD